MYLYMIRLGYLTKLYCWTKA